MIHCHKNRTKLPKYAAILMLCFLVITSILVGCGNPNHAASGEPTSPTERDPVADRYLRIRLTADPEADWFSEFPSESLGGNFTEGLTYFDVKDVTIEIDGQTWNLEEALRDGAITEEDIFYYARKDAAAGICQENSGSALSLTSFTYVYPEYDLRLIYDILSTPTGSDHLISHMALYPHNSSKSPHCHFVDSDTNTIYTREDWGLTFEAANVSPTGITINTTQSGGQQIGQFFVIHYELLTDGTPLERIDANKDSSPLLNDRWAITMNGTGERYVDWSEFYGELPRGEYSLYLYITDVFDESQVHPLMVDYHQNWCYGIEFSIP